MFTLNKRQRAIRMKRLEGKNRAQQGALTLGIIKLKGKEYIYKRPLHAIGIALFSVMVFNKTKRSSAFLLSFKQLNLILSTIKTESSYGSSGA